MSGIGAAANKLQVETPKVANESAGTKAEMRTQMITVSSQNANASGVGSGGRQNEPFVTHKLIISKDQITGDEEFTVIDEWFKDLLTDLETIMRGTKARMKASKNETVPIDEAASMRHTNAETYPLVSGLAPELIWEAT